MSTPHPYYPPTLLLPDYVASDASAGQLLLIMASISMAILMVAWNFTRWIRPRSSPAERAKACWFFFSANMHLFFEGYFVFSQTGLAADTSLPAQLWKEYALSDSRYLSGDSFVRSIETLTVLFLGPLAMFTAFSIASYSPHRHALTILTCLCHIYGATLYYATEFVGGVPHSRPEFVYFWIYFVGFNIAWIIIPGWLGWHSYSEIVSATEQTDGRKIEKIEKNL